MGKKTIKQSTMNLILSFFNVVGFIILAVCIISISTSFNSLVKTEERKTEYKELGLTLANGSDYLTKEIRSYSVLGDKVHYDNYWKEVNETKSRDIALQRLNELNPTQEELDLLDSAKRRSDSLISVEEEAMIEVENSNFERAQELVFGSAYSDAVKEIMGYIDEFQLTMNGRAERDLQKEINDVSRAIIWLIVTSVFLAVINFLNISYSFLKIIRPLVKFKDYMISLAEGDLTFENNIPMNNSEIGQLSESITKSRNDMSALITNIKNEVINIDNIENEIDINVNNLNDDMTSISGAVQELSASMEETAATAEEMNASSYQMEKMAQYISEKTNEGEEKAIHISSKAKKVMLDSKISKMKQKF